MSRYIRTVRESPLEEEDTMLTKETICRVLSVVVRDTMDEEVVKVSSKRAVYLRPSGDKKSSPPTLRPPSSALNQVHGGNLIWTRGINN